MFKSSLKEVEVETKAGKRKSQRMNERFLKGPIPMRLIAQAAKLPGQSLSVYLATHHQSALTRCNKVTLPKGLLSQLGVSRDAKSRALKELVHAGLVKVESVKGKSTRVSLSTERSNEAKSEAEPLANHQWAVTDVGIECLAMQYFIAKELLTELRDATKGIAMWPVQLAEKSWVDIEAFLPVFESALAFHKPFGAEAIDRATTFSAARTIVAQRRNLPVDDINRIA